MAPDFEYFLRGSTRATLGHSLSGQFLFCLPLTVAMYWLITKVVARPLAVRLPRMGQFEVHDYQLLAEQPPWRTHWPTVVMSALVGSFSHIAWDAFTHRTGAAVQALTPLARSVSFAGGVFYPYHIFQHASTLIGGVAAIVMLHRIGRRRALVHWTEARGLPASLDAPVTAPMRFWLWVSLFCMVGVIVGMRQQQKNIYWGLAYGWIGAWLRATSITFVGLCVACWWVRRTRGVRRDVALAID
jgi:membrane-bound metal-dependent hydrolase YbcI (DUF457 family)